MVARHTQIGEYSIDPSKHAIVVQIVGHEAEITPYRCETGIGESPRYGIGVLVERIEMPLVAQALHDGTAVTAAAERGVDIYAVGTYVEGFKTLGQKGRYVINFLIHNLLAAATTIDYRPCGFGSVKLLLFCPDLQI